MAHDGAAQTERLGSAAPCAFEVVRQRFSRGASGAEPGNRYKSFSPLEKMFLRCFVIVRPGCGLRGAFCRLTPNPNAL